MYEGELPMQEALLLAPAAIQALALKKRWVIVAGSSVILGQVAAGNFRLLSAPERALMHDNDEKLAPRERGKRLFESV